MRSSRLVGLVISLSALVACLGPASALADGWPFDANVPPLTAGATGNLLVLLDQRRGAAAAGHTAVRAVLARAGGGLAGKAVPQIGLITIRPPAGVSLAAFAARLRGLRGVASVELEHRYAPRLVPSDPALTAPSQYSGVIEWYLAREGFYHAWDVTHGSGALVGVIDTGIDGRHPDLRSKIAAAVDQQAPGNDSGPALTDQVGHGTHVASLACADTNNGIGMAGAGYDCRLVIEKTDFTDSSIAASIVDATNRGAQALNMSFGPATPTTAPPPPSLVRALDYAAAHNVVLVAAAADSPATEQGDPANVLQPAGTGPYLTVGLGLDVTAADYTGSRASFAGYGSEISLAAYGAFEPDSSALLGVGPPPGIFGAFPANSTQFEQFPDPCLCRANFGGSSDYAYLQGTSMAAPQVAATAAMMRVLNPFATLRDVLTTIKETAQRPTGTGWTPDLGWGILDAGAAIQTIRYVDRLAPVAHLYAPHVTEHRVFVLRWSGHDQQYPGLIPSGMAYYDVYVRSDSGRRRLLARTAASSLVFHGRPGRRYTFSLIAVDRAGNREVVAARARTRVAR